MSEFLSRYGALLLDGTLESLYMTLVPTLLAYVIGLPLGVLLTVTKPGGFMETPQFNAAFGWLVNIFRSIPFMILMLFLTPFTRAVMGTSIGASAANLPLTVAAAPFVARMVEQSLEEVDGGVIEAARCMGATNWQIITRVLRPDHQHHHGVRLHGHHRRDGCGRPGQHRLPLRLPALSAERDVRLAAAGDRGGVPDPDGVRPSGQQGG